MSVFGFSIRQNSRQPRLPWGLREPPPPHEGREREAEVDCVLLIGQSLWESALCRVAAPSAPPLSGDGRRLDDLSRIGRLQILKPTTSGNTQRGTSLHGTRVPARSPSKFGVPQSRCLPIAGRPITNYAKNTPLRVDVYGYCLKIVTSAEHDGSGNSATLLLIFSPYG